MWKRFSDATLIPTATAQTDRAGPRMDVDIYSNHLLNGLPRVERKAIALLTTIVDLPQSRVIMPAGEDARFVFFPLDGMISLLMVMQDGKAVETATVGREGGIGLMSAFGPYHSIVRAVASVPTIVARIPAQAFCTFAETYPSIGIMARAYNEVLLKQATVTAACNGLHQIAARFCRRILQSCDRADSHVVPLTQETLSEMLGVRRTSVTDVASRLQNEGIISYARGIITVLDFDKLKQISCECYDTLRVPELA